jgi:aminoglycoside phosphotransferase (APT) family kinase protein
MTQGWLAKSANLMTVTQELPPVRLVRILEQALPGSALTSCEPLTDGASNLNYLLRFVGSNDPLVLRIYTRDPGACAKELAILRPARGIIPVPEVIHAGSQGDDAPYVLYRFVEGITFQELKRKGNARDLAEAAYAMGSALARVGAVAPPQHLAPRPAITNAMLSSPLLEHRLGCRERDRFGELLSRWWPEIGALYGDRTLVHGDFNNRNTILRQEEGRWVVAGILDWEMAFVGSPLWDAARFLCYEHPSRPCREPHFSRGFTESGGKLPHDWTNFARAINAATAAESLGRPDLPARLIPELRELIAAT